MSVLEVKSLSPPDAIEMAMVSMGKDTPREIVEGVVMTSRRNPGAITMLCNLPSDVLSSVLTSSTTTPPTTPTGPLLSPTAENDVMRRVLTSHKLSTEDLKLLGRLAPLRAVVGKFPPSLFDELVKVGQ